MATLGSTLKNQRVEFDSLATTYRSQGMVPLNRCEYGADIDTKHCSRNEVHTEFAREDLSIPDQIRERLWDMARKPSEIDFLNKEDCLAVQDFKTTRPDAFLL